MNGNFLSDTILSNICKNGGNMRNRIYAAIDLKSFYASVECIERGLDPLDTNLVVADSARTEKTICLAVTPTLKAYGISGRARLFEVVERLKQVNMQRGSRQGFSGSSYSAKALDSDQRLRADYIIAPPRMAYYMQYSARIYNVYLKYVSAEDIHVYSIDEVFIDLTSYLKTYGLTPRELTMKIILDVLKTTGITATAGIGTNLFLAKIAMDIEAKHIPADENGVRIAELDEEKYRHSLWSHTPLTDFWRVGRGYAKRLEEHGMRTMGDIARCSIKHEDLLYRLFGVNAELLIDHAWGYEPCTIAEIKAYRPENTSICSGQVLQTPYAYDKARLIVREMSDLLVLDLVEKRLVTDQITLTVGYDIDNISEDGGYDGEVTTDRYGRSIPKHAHGTVTLHRYTSSTKEIIDAVTDLYERIINKKLLVRRINISANRLLDENDASKREEAEQLDFFSYLESDTDEQDKNTEKEKERRKQEAMISIKNKYGKNAIVKGMNLEDGATTMSRNRQIGGHKA